MKSFGLFAGSLMIACTVVCMAAPQRGGGGNGRPSYDEYDRPVSRPHNIGSGVDCRYRCSLQDCGQQRCRYNCHRPAVCERNVKVTQYASGIAPQEISAPVEQTGAISEGQQSSSDVAPLISAKEAIVPAVEVPASPDSDLIAVPSGDKLGQPSEIVPVVVEPLAPLEVAVVPEEAEKPAKEEPIKMEEIPVVAPVAPLTAESLVAEKVTVEVKPVEQPVEKVPSSTPKKEAQEVAVEKSSVESPQVEKIAVVDQVAKEVSEMATVVKATVSEDQVHQQAPTEVVKAEVTADRTKVHVPVEQKQATPEAGIADPVEKKDPIIKEMDKELQVKEQEAAKEVVAVKSEEKSQDHVRSAEAEEVKKVAVKEAVKPLGV